MNRSEHLFLFTWRIGAPCLINLATNIALMFLLALSIHVSVLAEGHSEELDEQEPYFILEEILVIEKGYGVEQNLTATKTNTPLRDVPQSIQVINKDLFKDQSGRYLNDVLKNISSVNQFSEYLDYNMRGFRNNTDGAIKMDGLNQVHGFFHRLRLNNVERVEVIKGPASALYGQSKPGGFINVITKQPQANPETEFSVHYGSYSKRDVNFSTTGPIPFVSDNELLYRIDVGHLNAKGFRDHEQFIYSRLSGALTWLPTSQTSITLGAEWFDDLSKGHRNRGVPFFNGELADLSLNYTVNEPSDFISIEAYTYRLQADHRFSDTGRASLKAGYLTNQRRQEYHEPRGLLDDGRTMRREFRDQFRERDQFNIDTNVVYDLDIPMMSHKFLGGFDYTFIDGLSRYGTARDSQWNAAEGGGPVPDLDIFNPVFETVDRPLKYAYYGDDIFGGISKTSTSQDDLLTRVGVYLQDQIKIGEQFNVLGGVRFDSFTDETQNDEDDVRESSDNKATFRGGVVYKPVQEISTYVSYGQGFDPIRARYNYNPEQYGGPFDPELSWTVESGAKAHFLDNRLNTTIAAYHINKENTLLRSPTEALPDRRVQVGEFVSQGIELDIAGKILDQLSIHGSYTFSLKAEVTEDVDPELIGKPAENNPDHAFSVWSRYNIPVLVNEGVLGFAVGLNYMGDRLTFTEGDVLPAFFSVNAAAFFNYGNINIALSLFNLFDEEFFPSGYGGRIGGFRGTPRSVEGKLGYRF